MYIASDCCFMTQSTNITKGKKYELKERRAMRVQSIAESEKVKT